VRARIEEERAMKPAECGIAGLTIVTEQPEAMASMTTWPGRLDRLDGYPSGAGPRRWAHDLLFATTPIPDRSGPSR
jgi:hypothetical protein